MPLLLLFTLCTCSGALSDPQLLLNYSSLTLPDLHVPYFLHGNAHVARVCQDDPLCPFKVRNSVSFFGCFFFHSFYSFAFNTFSVISLRYKMSLMIKTTAVKTTAYNFHFNFSSARMLKNLRAILFQMIMMDISIMMPILDHLTVLT